MTTCPDNWEVTADGKCLIPSADIPNANIGTLRYYKYPIYKFKLKNDDDIIDKFIYLPEIDFNGNTIYGEIYKDKSNHVLYHYDISGMIPQNAYKNAYNKEKDLEVPIAIDFYSDDWTRFQGVNSRTCQVQNWIKKFNIQWDGLTQYNQCNIFKQSDNNTSSPTYAPKENIIPSKNSNMYGEKNDTFIKV
jgi:hypothetical protein